MVTAFVGDRPAAQFCVAKSFLTRPSQLAFDGIPQSVAPLVGLRQATIPQAQAAKMYVVIVLAVPGASRQLASRIEHQQVPRVVIFRRLMQAVGGELISRDSAVLSVDVAPKPLDLSNEPGVSFEFKITTRKQVRNVGARGGK